MKTRVTRALSALLVVAVASCGDSGTASTTDTVATDTVAPSDTTSPTDTAVGDTATGDTGATDDTTAADTSQPDPNDPCNYVFSDKTAYITELALGSMSETTGAGGKPDDHCCFDQNSDGSVDNRLGEIINDIQGLPQITRTVNGVIADNIADGTITILAENVGLDSLVSASGATVNFFYGVDTDTDHQNNLSGEGSFTAKLSSFKAGTAEPRVSFPGVTVTNGNLFVGPGVFRLDIPLANGLAIAADIQNTRIEGKIAAGPHGGVTLDGADSHGGKLGGIIRQDDLFGAFNTFVGSFCSCLQVQGGGDALQKTGEVWGCATFDKAACDANDAVQNQCRVLADVCGLALALITPDIDTDSSGAPDAFSVGFWFRATGATLVGVDPATCSD